MPAAERSIFIRVKDGPRGERRNCSIGRTDDVHEARRDKALLERAGHTVVLQADRRPPHSF